MFIHLFALALLATAQARYIALDDLKIQPYVIDVANLAQDDFEDALSEQAFESVHPGYLNRVRRELGSMSSLSTNADGSVNLNLKVPIVRGESNVLSAVGSASGIQQSESGYRAAGVKPGPGYAAAGGGFALDNINGHGLSVTGQHIPGLGNQATAAGRLLLVNAPNHKLGANAFVTRAMPNIHNLPNFNTYGGSVDYTFKDKIGGSLGMAHTDLFKKTDYSAMGHLNLFRGPSTSLDLNAGWTKSQSSNPAYNNNWAPQGGLSFTKYF
ncbi:attacin-like [Leguminivora glycinivorella]|uniref:attacin-like n=1 Tax=Leguminivora glycinivorella TaxID=1035111 RepID=UPI00200F35F9|nr:attacin-like [Leguminivora glycinivorella]